MSFIDSLDKFFNYVGEKAGFEHAGVYPEELAKALEELDKPPALPPKLKLQNKLADLKLEKGKIERYFKAGSIRSFFGGAGKIFKGNSVTEFIQEQHNKRKLNYSIGTGLALLLTPQTYYIRREIVKLEIAQLEIQIEALKEASKKDKP